MALRVGVLGPVAAWYDDQELHVGQPRQQAVLGILAMRANRVISRSELVDAVWGQDPPPSAEGGIYTYVAGLRRVIEVYGPVIEKLYASRQSKPRAAAGAAAH